MIQPIPDSERPSRIKNRVNKGEKKTWSRTAIYVHFTYPAALTRELAVILEVDQLRPEGFPLLHAVVRHGSPALQ